jgi:hypothetical protein
MKTQENLDYIFGNRISKIDRYNWSAQDQPGEFKLIQKNLLKVNYDYQRNAESKIKILRLASNWSWVACGSICVGHRDGEYWVIDGQHRTLAAKRRADIEELPCMVFDTQSVKQEARGFLNANTARKPITSLDKFRAKIAARDEVVLFVNTTFEELSIKPCSTAINAREIKCLDWVVKKAEANRDDFKIVLHTAALLCHSSYISEILLDGLHYIHLNASENLLSERLLLKLKKIGREGLLDSARRASAFFARGGAKVWAEGMLTEINKGFKQKIVFSNANPR